MKFAILSDIHGNIYALEKCFKYIDEMNIDSIIWCGDYITDVPKSHEVIEFIKRTMNKYKTYIIKGNREDYIIDYHNSKNKQWTMENRGGSLLCAYNELTKEDIEFISSLPDTCIIDINNEPQIFVSHKREYIKGNECKYKVFGHSHKQFVFSKDNIKYINPGSVGITTGGRIGAEFAVLEITEKFSKVESYQIEYDITKPIEQIQASKLNDTTTKWGDAVIKAIKTATDYQELYVKEASNIAKEHGLDGNLDEIPTEIWEEAREILKL